VRSRGTQSVTISGLPANITSGSVYTENRSVTVSNGSFTDSFGQWDVHVYHFTIGTSSTPPPTISSFAPTGGPAGSSVTISGSKLTGATAVSFNGATASYTVVSDSQISATVPTGATSGPTSVTTPGGTAVSPTSFTVTAPDFSLSAAPSSQTIVRGGSATYTVSVNPTGGFNGSVNLAATGLPSGATASFTPNPTGGASTLKIQTTASTKPGGYTLTVTGTSGSLSHTATVTLQVKRK
jgi:hypothetical protein